LGVEGVAALHWRIRFLQVDSMLQARNKAHFRRRSLVYALRLTRVSATTNAISGGRLE
jgi:hypothetical protein